MVRPGYGSKCVVITTGCVATFTQNILILKMALKWKLRKDKLTLISKEISILAAPSIALAELLPLDLLLLSLSFPYNQRHTLCNTQLVKK